MTVGSKYSLAVLVMVLPISLGACSGSSGGGHCVSHYQQVAEAAQREALVTKLRSRPRVESAKVVGHHDGKTTVNLINRKRRIVVQVDIWEVSTGNWRASKWLQCID